MAEARCSEVEYDGGDPGKAWRRCTLPPHAGNEHAFGAWSVLARPAVEKERETPAYHRAPVTDKLQDYPHPRACEGCAVERLCHHCGKVTLKWERCTNVGCPDCCSRLHVHQTS